MLPAAEVHNRSSLPLRVECPCKRSTILRSRQTWDIASQKIPVRASRAESFATADSRNRTTYAARGHREKEFASFRPSYAQAALRSGLRDSVWRALHDADPEAKSGVRGGDLWPL